jgi:hypothetical protein
LVKVKQRYIKSENRKWLIGYFLLHIVIFALFSSLINFSLIDADQLISKLKNPQGFIPLTAAILIIVMEGIFKNSIKEFFVFWKFKNRLPGHRAFSHIGPTDPRIDMERVKQLFPHGLPEGPKEQNNEWFRLYRQHQDELQVFHSHKAFLLTRDLTSLTVVFIPLSILGHFLLGSRPQMLIYHLLIFVMLFVGISLSARHYGERFVANVLVETSIKQPY